MYYSRTRTDSFFDAFTLNPLPYPVLLILAVIAVFLGVSWFVSYEEILESAETQMSWILLFIPLVLIVIVRWLSSVENTDFFSIMSPWDKRRATHYRPPSSEGSSPWGVAAVIALLLVLVYFQSSFLDSWF